MARRQVTIDPAVAAILQDGTERKRRRGMTDAQRRRAERQAAVDAQRSRTTLELDARVVEMLEKISSAEGCSKASVVNLLVAAGVQAYVAGEVSFEEQRRRSRSPRYEWTVELNGRVGALMKALGEFLNRREI